jgi:hypothetical protein
MNSTTIDVFAFVHRLRSLESPKQIAKFTLTFSIKIIGKIENCHDILLNLIKPYLK